MSKPNRFAVGLRVADAEGCIRDLEACIRLARKRLSPVKTASRFEADNSSWGKYADGFMRKLIRLGWPHE